MHECLGIIVFI